MTNRAPLHREAVAAMWLFGEQYAQSRGALDLWRGLPQHQRDACREFVETVIAAPPTPHPEIARIGREERKTP